MNMLAREGEWGWVHTLVTGVDHSASFVEATIHYRDPEGTVTAQTCDVVDESVGEYGWTVDEGFFTAGRWTAQLELDLGTDGVRKLRTPVSFWIGEGGV